MPNENTKPTDDGTMDAEESWAYLEQRLGPKPAPAEAGAPEESAVEETRTKTSCAFGILLRRRGSSSRR
jgi:hypothetical protein